MFDFIWKFGLGFASCILLGLWLDRKNGSAQAGGTPSAAGATEASAAKTDATETPETTASEDLSADPAAAESDPEGATVLALTEDGLPKADIRKADIRKATAPATAAVAEQINWNQVGAVAGKVLKTLWKITVWIFKNGSKLAGNYSYDNMAGKNIQSS